MTRSQNLSATRTPRQKWAQQRIDEIYADNGHPYFTSNDGRRGRMSAAMLKLFQENTPPDRPLQGRQVISATSLMGNDVFATAEDAADYLARAAGKSTAPTPPGPSGLGGGIQDATLSGATARLPRKTAADSGSEGSAAKASLGNGVSDLLRIPDNSTNEPAVNTLSDQAHVASPHRESPDLPPMIANPTGGLLRNDDWARGHFGAKRTHGPHEGVDILTKPGVAVSAPIDGKISKHGFLHGDKRQEYYDVEIEGSGKYLGMTTRVFYIEENSRLAIGMAVKAGQTSIGSSDDPRPRYDARMKPHVHIQIEWRGKNIDPARVLPNWPSGKP